MLDREGRGSLRRVCGIDDMLLGCSSARRGVVEGPGRSGLCPWTGNRQFNRSDLVFDEWRWRNWSTHFGFRFDSTSSSHFGRISIALESRCFRT